MLAACGRLVVVALSLVGAVFLAEKMHPSLALLFVAKWVAVALFILCVGLECHDLDRRPPRF